MKKLVSLTLALMIALLALVPAMAEETDTRKLGVLCAFSMLLGLCVTNLVIKNWVARVRPYELIEELELIIEKQHDFSFPSGHATNALACAWVMFRLLDKKAGIPALILALLICFTRLHVGVHYPTDVLAGIIVGIFAAELAIQSARNSS